MVAIFATGSIVVGFVRLRSPCSFDWCCCCCCLVSSGAQDLATSSMFDIDWRGFCSAEAMAIWICYDHRLGKSLAMASFSGFSSVSQIISSI
jgi:hypothetical protein